MVDRSENKPLVLGLSFFNSNQILTPKEMEGLDVKPGEKDHMTLCDLYISDYKFHMANFHKARAYAVTLGIMGAGMLVTSPYYGGGWKTGSGVAVGAGALFLSYKSVERMTEFQGRAADMKLQFLKDCMEPKPVLRQLPLPDLVERVSLVSALHASMYAGPIPTFEIPEPSAWESTKHFVDKNATAIAYGAGATVVAGAAIAIVAFNWTGVVALLDPALPALATASATMGARSAQLFQN